MRLMKRATLIFALVGLSVFQAELVFADQTTDNTIHPTMVVMNLDKEEINANQLTKIDLKNTLIQITASDTHVDAQDKVNKALKLLAAKSNHYPVILGFVVTSVTPLNRAAAQDIATLATKATFISTKFSFETPKDWQLVLDAEQKNPNLLSVVYGTKAILQLQMMPEMGASFANTDLAFIHIFIPNDVSRKSAISFWQQVSQTLKATKHALGIIVLESGSNNKFDYNTIVKSSIDEADGYLFWLGDKSNGKLTAVTLNATHLSVWRKTTDGIKSFSYARTESPQSLYAALGTTRPSYAMLSSFTTRAKKAMIAGIDLLGDAETNIHSLGVLLDFANTVVCDNDTVYLPPDISSVTLSKLNILVSDPSKTTIQKISDDSMILKESMMQQDYIGVFDYSIKENAIFYTQLGSWLANFPGVSISYNTDNLSSLQAILDIGVKNKIKELNLGPEASALYSNKANDTIKKMAAEVKVHLYEN
ncbi:MAG: hypothetical protein P4M14_04380 [Gammaproteobacteria bacterium]|nr:hypothetical protein [Gammaproteobacteria bacterium]